MLMDAIALYHTEFMLAFLKAGAPAVSPFDALGLAEHIRLFASHVEGVGCVFDPAPRSLSFSPSYSSFR